jgi:hypothetical protein
MTLDKARKYTDGKTTAMTRSSIATANKKFRSRNTGPTINGDSMIDP